MALLLARPAFAEDPRNPVPGTKEDTNRDVTAPHKGAIIVEPKPALDEATLLWDEAQTLIRGGKLGESAFRLQRLIAKFPASPHFLEAHWTLADVLMQQRKYEEAKKPLKYFIGATGKSNPGHAARLRLGRAQLKTGKPKEALLTALDVLNGLGKHQNDHSLPANALLLKAWALLALDKDSEAQLAHSSSEKYAVTAEAVRLEQEFKLRTCRLLPSPAVQKNGVEEGDLRAALKRRATCLLEGTVFLLKAAESPVATERAQWVEDSQKTLAQDYAAYARLVQTPPKPPGKRSAIELQRYRDELRQVLVADFNEFRGKVFDLLETWKKTGPAAILEAVQSLEKSLKELQ